MFVLVEMVLVHDVPGADSEWTVASVWGPFDTAMDAQVVAEQHAFLSEDDPDDDSVYRWIVKELY